MPHHGEAVGVGAAFVTVLPTYTVYREGATYYAVNNDTGGLDFGGADPAVVVQACLTAGGAGTTIGMREAIYVALTGVAATANNQGVYGLGEGTYWDATALLTGVHAFTISGFTGCELRNFAIETEADGTKTCHCVFIEDGADNFHLVDITVVDSDSDAIHIEGTTITQGHIHRCHIEGADGVGIRVNMDDLNYIYRLHIEDCDIVACGADGILFDASAGNLYCEVVNNIIFGCAGDGIDIRDADYSMIRGNACINNTLWGIIFHYSDHAQVRDNICQGGTESGIWVKYCNDINIGGNISQGTARYGLSLDHSAFCTITGNNFIGNGYHGINLTYAVDSSITGNVIQGSGKKGIYVVDESNKNTITGNTIYQNTEDGIKLEGSNGCTIVGNTINENDVLNTATYNGITLVGSSNNLILGNTLRANDGWGISIGAVSDYNKVSNNYTEGNTGGSIQVTAATADGTEIVFNTVEEGAPADAGTLTRASGNFDPSADAYIAIIGAAPF